MLTIMILISDCEACIVSLAKSIEAVLNACGLRPVRCYSLNISLAVEGRVNLIGSCFTAKSE